MGPLPSVNMEELQPALAADTSPILHFPISPGCVHPTASQRQEYATIVHERVTTLLQYEQRFNDRRNQLLSPVDTREWKLVQTSKDLRFYQQIRRDRMLVQVASEEALSNVRQAATNGYATMLGEGQVQGSLENVMYGLTASSQQDLMTVFSYKNAPRDCVWLGTAEGPTQDDPFHSADIIWAMPKVKAYAIDTCYLKATGVQVDRRGDRYGYLILHSVELPQCRPFDARGVARVKMYFGCLFRELCQGLVQVTVRGSFDLGTRTGTLVTTLVSLSIKSFMVGLFNCAGIGLAKKLTLMARRNHRELQSPKQTKCTMCFTTRKKSLFGFTTHLYQCAVCGATACSNCIATTKQILFLGLDAPRSKRPCCFTCMRDARVTCGVRPGEPQFHVVADFYLRHGAPSSSTPVSVTHASPRSAMYPLDTVSRTRESQSRSVLKTDMSADMPTNSTAKDSLDTDSFARDLDEADFGVRKDESNVVPPDARRIRSAESTVTLWRGTHDMHANDFIPKTARAVPHSGSKLMQTLVQLNVEAEHIFKQTQATARAWTLRG